MTTTYLAHERNSWEGRSSDQTKNWKALSWDGVNNRVKNFTKLVPGNFQKAGENVLTTRESTWKTNLVKTGVW